MKLSISNIAWKKDDDASVYALIKKYGYAGIDIAPSRIWSDMYHVSDDEVRTFREMLSSQNLVVGGMQSLLYNRPDLTIFENEIARKATGEALKQMIELGSRVGARAVVFGSPKNRIMGDNREEKYEIAVDFFHMLGEYARAHDIAFCLEPNPIIYGGDFLTHTRETFDFVERVNSAGLKVNLDMGTALANDEELSKLIEEKGAHIGHVHISMPLLKPVVLSETHRKITEVLRTAGYTGWIAIEMACIEGEDRLATIEGIVRDVQEMVA